MGSCYSANKDQKNGLPYYDMRNSSKKATIGKGEKIEPGEKEETKKYEEYPKSGKKELALKDSRYYRKKISLVLADFVVPRSVYEKLGQYAYKGEKDFDDLYEVTGANVRGLNCVYIGQIKPGTEIAEGVGIMVSEDGGILEGYWKNNKLHGLGRSIAPNGEYYIGEWREANSYGQGEYHWPDGEWHKGKFEKGEPKGYGKRAYSDGKTKYGDWNGWYVAI